MRWFWTIFGALSLLLFLGAGYLLLTSAHPVARCDLMYPDCSSRPNPKNPLSLPNADILALFYLSVPGLFISAVYGIWRVGMTLASGRQKSLR